MALCRVLSFALIGAGLGITLYAQAPAGAVASQGVGGVAPVAAGGFQGNSRTGGRANAPRPKSDPTPRWPDGHPMLGPAPGKLGFWNAGTGGLTGKNGMNLPTNLEISEVPFMPWS